MNLDDLTIKCVVCNRKKQYGRKIQFFRFPRDSGKCRSWVKVIGKKNLLTLTLDEFYEKYVCESHFPPECINQNANRLHKVALPTLATQLPPLNDDLLSNFLLTKDKTEMDPTKMNAKVDGPSKVLTYVRASKATVHNHPLPVVNYERPLMTCLETLLHNDQNYVKKPAGILNTISVPLLTYISSMEKGTVFAASAPETLSFELPNIKPKKMTKTKPVNSISFIEETIATSDKDATLTLNNSSSHHSTLKQYKKTTIQSYKHVGLHDKLPQPGLVHKFIDKSNKDAMDIQSENQEVYERPTMHLNADITHVPYTEHDVNATPEESNAYVQEDWFDFRLPLMNCVDILNEAKISTSAECMDHTFIDVPLLNCFKTLEYTEHLDIPSIPSYM